MGQDVVHPARGELAEPLEVRAPDVVGRAAGVPDVEAVVVQRAVGEEVDRADDVVPVAPLEQRAHALLAARDEVRLDAQAQVRLLAHEAHVLVDVVARRLHPQRMVPDLERLGEAIHVLGHAQLLDPALRRDLAIALGVGRGERRLGGRARGSSTRRWTW